MLAIGKPLRFVPSADATLALGQPLRFVPSAEPSLINKGLTNHQQSAEQPKTSPEVDAAKAKNRAKKTGSADGSFLEEHDGEPLLRPLAIESIPEIKPGRRPFFEVRPMGRSALLVGSSPAGCSQ